MLEPDSPNVLSATIWAATHALPVFGAMLVLLLLCVATLWLLTRRYGVHHETSAFPPLAYLIAYLASGFALMTAAASLFAEVAENVGDGSKLGQLDLVFSNTVAAHVSQATLQVFAMLTRLGDPLVLGICGAVVALVLIWQRHYLLCAAWALAAGGNALLNPTLKIIFARARPVHENGLAHATGYSFPSGHSSGSVVVYGMLAYVLVKLLPARWSAARLPVVLAATALAYSVGCSRVFLQVHFASDVLAGFASGATWLVMCIVAVELVLWRQRRMLQ
ncbi:MAG: phosphoesterase, PA-phosphatase related protein [Polaromonas sp.]|nr:phosphoesterase, PA-phosphatase related protein [Polaromonas sp.]